MERIANLFGQYKSRPKRTRQTERGDIYDTILSRINPGRIKKGYQPVSHGRLTYLLTGIPTKDLYALISRCDDAERRGYPWGAIFFKEIKPNDEK